MLMAGDTGVPMECACASKISDLQATWRRAVARRGYMVLGNGAPCVSFVFSDSFSRTWCLLRAEIVTCF